MNSWSSTHVQWRTLETSFQLFLYQNHQESWMKSNARRPLCRCESSARSANIAIPECQRFCNSKCTSILTSWSPPLSSLSHHLPISIAKQRYLLHTICFVLCNLSRSPDFFFSSIPCIGFVPLVPSSTLVGKERVSSERMQLIPDFSLTLHHHHLTNHHPTTNNLPSVKHLPRPI